MNGKWILAACVALGVSWSSGAEPATSTIAECKSRNVWDAGYALSFDLASYRDLGEFRTISARIYQLVPLWRKELVFGDIMAQRQVHGNAACGFELVDQVQEPQTRIAFEVARVGAVATTSIYLDLLLGTRPERFDELECDPRLVQMLATFCAR